MLYERFIDVCRTFNDEGVDYLVVGAAALSLHGIPRGTQDLDFFVRPTAENFERIRRALSRIWDDPEIREITHEPPAVIRYGTPDGLGERRHTRASSSPAVANGSKGAGLALQRASSFNAKGT